MKPEDFYKKFKQQYKKSDWDTLNSNLDFKAALATDDFDKAGLLADRILIGETKSIREGREMKKLHDVFDKFKD